MTSDSNKQPSESRAGKVEGLKPCPFCGRDKAMDMLVQFTNLHYIECRNCFVRTEALCPKSAAIAAWNRRPSPPGPPANVQPGAGDEECPNCGLPDGQHHNLCKQEEIWQLQEAVSGLEAERDALRAHKRVEGDGELAGKIQAALKQWDEIQADKSLDDFDHYFQLSGDGAKAIGVLRDNSPAILAALSTAKRLEWAEGLLRRMKFELDRHGDSYHHTTDRQVLNDYDAFLSPPDATDASGGLGKGMDGVVEGKSCQQ